MYYYTNIRTNMINMLALTLAVGLFLTTAQTALATNNGTTTIVQSSIGCTPPNCAAIDTNARKNNPR